MTIFTHTTKQILRKGFSHEQISNNSLKTLSHEQYSIKQNLQLCEVEVLDIKLDILNTIHSKLIKATKVVELVINQ